MPSLDEMMASFREDLQKDLEEIEKRTIPGSKTKRPGIERTREETEKELEKVQQIADETAGWDSDPIHLTVQGQEREFFLISALAAALNRKPQSIRLWERKGYLPEARFRKAGKNRLYTRAQIEGLQALAVEEGLMDPDKRKRIDRTNFPERAEKLFIALERAGL